MCYFSHLYLPKGPLCNRLCRTELHSARRAYRDQAASLTRPPPLSQQSRHPLKHNSPHGGASVLCEQKSRHRLLCFSSDPLSYNVARLVTLDGVPGPRIRGLNRCEFFFVLASIAIKVQRTRARGHQGAFGGFKLFKQAGDWTIFFAVLLQQQQVPGIDSAGPGFHRFSLFMYLRTCASYCHAAWHAFQYLGRN